MDALKIGQQVLVMNEATHEMVYEPVDSFIHRRADIETRFIDLSTSAGTHMSLTPGHMVPVADCVTGASITLKAASEASVGECVLVNENGQIRPAQISTRSESVKTGIFAPLTKSGTVMVGNTVGSCYSNFEGYFVQNTFYRLFTLVQQLLFGYLPASPAAVDVPPALYLFQSISQ